MQLFWNKYIKLYSSFKRENTLFHLFLYYHIKSLFWELRGNYSDLGSESLSVVDRQKKLIRPYKQLFIIAFSWKVAVAQCLIYVIFQGSRNTFCSPSDTFYELVIEVWVRVCSLQKEQDKCKNGYSCVADNAIIDFCSCFLMIIQFNGSMVFNSSVLLNKRQRLGQIQPMPGSNDSVGELGTCI